jgi:hypothetical protein
MMNQPELQRALMGGNMSLGKQLDEAVDRLKDASARVEQARAQPASLETLWNWTAALSDFCFALSDINSFNNESVHEKLHELAERARVTTVAPATRARRTT